ncbi:TlpA family protein disulfide reductase [Gryllotalpicola reticulitermitis]|uniref:TlpA family protein disulfide reductase n=1 Tax=Gryllotalpicola reticulitermitis TaxID=1184153 RepID=A0ABV8Q8Q5_9MICO
MASFSGSLATGGRFDSSTALGKVAMVNFWWAGCAPCRLEAPELQRMFARFGTHGVVFVGVNTRDDAAAARSFEETFGVTYPSILDATSGAVQLSFANARPPRATPTTLVLDKTGRVAASVIGPVNAYVSALDTVIPTLLRE